MVVLHDGLPVFIQVVLTAGQLQEGGQAVQVCHFVEGAQQEVHHHETHEQVDCREGRETEVRRSFIQRHNVQKKVAPWSWILEIWLEKNTVHIKVVSIFYLVSHIRLIRLKTPATDQVRSHDVKRLSAGN